MVSPRTRLVVAMNTQTWVPKIMHAVHFFFADCVYQGIKVVEAVSTSLDVLMFDYLASVMQQLKLREQHLVSSRYPVFVFVFLNLCAPPGSS
jgi:hypothetical protein